MGRKRTSKRASRNHYVTYVLFVLAGIMLLGSAVGSTRAALTYRSDNYMREISVSQIGVTLLENGKVVSSRDYDKDEWKISTNRGGAYTSGALFQNLLKKDESLVLNKKYDENLAVRNSGTIDEYVRVRIYKYWMQGGKKITTLSPDLIDLNLVNGDTWISNPDNTRECTELYHKGILASGAETKTFTDTVRISGKVAAEAQILQEGNVVKTVYKYDGAEFHVDVEVDAVQTHNAQDVIKSAWGVDASALGIL